MLGIKNINNYMESAEFISQHKSHTYENISEDDVVSFENFGKLNKSRNEADEVLMQVQPQLGTLGPR
tara:strand:- start:267 stop:467 length:201 start_codon:yes stop_codon:yes gene_type:complete